MHGNNRHAPMGDVPGAEIALTDSEMETCQKYGTAIRRRIEELTEPEFHTHTELSLVQGTPTLVVRHGPHHGPGVGANVPLASLKEKHNGDFNASDPELDDEFVAAVASHIVSSGYLLFISQGPPQN